MTDSSYTILSLLRVHKFDADAKCAVREKYPFSHSANMNLDLITIDPEQVKIFIEGKDLPKETDEVKQEAPL